MLQEPETLYLPCHAYEGTSESLWKIELKDYVGTK